MRRNQINPLLCSISLLFIACSKKEEKKDDFFVFDFGTQARMTDQGFLKENIEENLSDKDLGGTLTSTADEKHKLEVTYSGGSWSINELSKENVKAIRIAGTVEKEIYVASSYYDHSLEKQVVLFIESIGSGDIDYTISIEDIIALRSEEHIQSELDNG